jgi:hypothetical protein
MTKDFDLVVIGGGPGGISGANIAAIFGKRVALVEKLGNVEDVRLLVWKPHGVLNEAALRRIMTLLEGIEATSNEPFNRFTDGQALDAIDLNFRYVFDFALFRRLSYAGRPPVKSSILVSSLTLAPYSELHEMLTRGSRLRFVSSKSVKRRRSGSESQLNC